MNPKPEKQEQKSVATKAPPEITSLAEEISRQVGPLLPQQQREAVLTRIVSVMSSERFSGPIAHPKHLREYEDIAPGSAERIISMAEKAQEHNRRMEEKIVDHQINDARRGMNYGFAGLVLLVLLAFAAGMFHNNVLATLLLSTAAFGTVAHFINGRLANGKAESPEKK
ncbi:DUF2335 domain-containing protein [Brucella pseudintermedia]|uniref:DUF2335 domain-containing protein n=2 Tax=Brucella pseudintermedia TaxID=370111 RepID=UPI001589C6A7|nr:DUF2335 domain-containing protein [Brucella pseudintermedia]